MCVCVCACVFVYLCERYPLEGLAFPPKNLMGMGAWASTIGGFRMSHIRFRASWLWLYKSVCAWRPSLGALVMKTVCYGKHFAFLLVVV